MFSLLIKVISKIFFGIGAPSGSPYVWKRKGVLRAASGSIEDRGHFGVDWNVFKVDSLSGSAKKVYTYLSTVADVDGYSFPFLRTIARRTKLSTSTVSKALRELEKVGLVKTEQRYSRRGGSSNLYHLRKVSDVYPQIAPTPPTNGADKNEGSS